MKLEVSIGTSAGRQFFGLFAVFVAQLQQQAFNRAMTDGELMGLGKFSGNFFGFLADPKHVFIGRTTGLYGVYIVD